MNNRRSSSKYRIGTPVCAPIIIFPHVNNNFSDGTIASGGRGTPRRGSCGERRVDYSFAGSAASPLLLRRRQYDVAAYTQSCNLTALVPLTGRSVIRRRPACQWPLKPPHLGHTRSVTAAPRNNRCVFRNTTVSHRHIFFFLLVTPSLVRDFRGWTTPPHCGAWAPIAPVLVLCVQQDARDRWNPAAATRGFFVCVRLSRTRITFSQGNFIYHVCVCMCYQLTICPRTTFLFQNSMTANFSPFFKLCSVVLVTC